MVTDEERIAQIQARQAKANANAKAQILRLRGKIRLRQRREDTRRKILVGAMHIDGIARGKYPLEALMTDIDGYLVRPADRNLFGLQARYEEDAEVSSVEIFRAALFRPGSRTRETRRKALVGALQLDKVERGELPASLLRLMMSIFLKNDRDRALFDLEPLPDLDVGNQAD